MILRLLGDHMSYNPGKAVVSGNTTGDGGPERLVSLAECSTDTYAFPRQTMELHTTDRSGRIHGLQGWLMSCLGYSEVDESTPGVDDGEDGLPEDEAVNRPERFPNMKSDGSRSKDRADASKADNRGNKRAAKKVIDILTSEAFVQRRPATQLANDLAVVAILVTAGYTEGWLDDKDFSELTHRTWSYLFFDDGSEVRKRIGPRGRLAQLHQAAGDKSQFEQAMGTIKLTAALTIWQFTCPGLSDSLEVSRFTLAGRLAVARLPWLWNLDSRNEVARELMLIADSIDWLNARGKASWRRLLNERDDCIAEGMSLARLERVLQQRDISEWRASITLPDVIPPGCLLWQGTHGFCATRKSVSRQRETQVDVITLRKHEPERVFEVGYLLPFRELVRIVSTDERWPLT